MTHQRSEPLLRAREKKRGMEFIHSPKKSTKNTANAIHGLDKIASVNRTMASLMKSKPRSQGFTPHGKPTCPPVSITRKSKFGLPLENFSAFIPSQWVIGSSRATTANIGTSTFFHLSFAAKDTSSAWSFPC